MAHQPEGTGLSEILATSELARRGARPPDFRVEAQVMAILAQTMADRPQAILQVLTDTAVELCGGGSAGISLLETQCDQAVFRWAAISGPLEKQVGAVIPRDACPCGVVLDRGAPQLFIRPARYFASLRGAEPEVLEALLIPFYHRNIAFGTIWIASHDLNRKFDLEDCRLMTQLGAFTAAGLKVIRALKLNQAG